MRFAKKGGFPNLMPLFFLLVKRFKKIVFTLLFKFVYILFIHIVILIIVFLYNKNHCFEKIETTRSIYQFTYAC